LGEAAIAEAAGCGQRHVQLLVSVALECVESASLVGGLERQEGLVASDRPVAAGALHQEAAAHRDLGVSSSCFLSSRAPAVQCSKAVNVTNHWPVFTNLPNARSDQ